MFSYRALVALFILGCAQDPDLIGTYSGAGTTPLPAQELGLPEGAILDVDATITFDGATEGNFELALVMTYTIDEASALTDTIDLGGTYVAANGELSLAIDEIEPGAGGTVIETDGSMHCVELAGFAGTPVCFAADQSNPYMIEGDELELTLEQQIATASGTTTVTVSREP
jgi:hypothetical protein